MPEVIIIGAGLTGLFAASLAAAKGARVTLVACGRGGLSLSHGCIDARYPTASLAAADPLPHPLALAGSDALRAACDQLQGLLTHVGLRYVGSLDQGVETLTPLGGRRSTQFAPESLVLPTQFVDGRAAIAGIQGFRDFMPALATRGWRGQGAAPQCLDDMPWPGDPPRRDLYATDLARQLECPDQLALLCDLWRPRLAGIECLGVPAVLGLTEHARVKAQLVAALGLHLFEIPTLPPSVPGLRLEAALRRAALDAGVTLIEGARALGRLEGDGAQRRALGVLVETAGGARPISADKTLLASGGVLNGGLHTDHAGAVIEATFGAPVATPAARDAWAGPGLSGPHEYPLFGVRVNDRMQPVDAAGEVFAGDLYAAGGLLAGLDRVRSNCRQGLDLATAYRAVEEMLR